MRRLIAFPCEGDTLVGTLDEAAGETGLLIVSGGNELRCGAHRGMAMLAANVAARGYPVFRFDRRGVGDSSGENRGYASSGPDIRAAAARFRAESPGLKRLIGLGNCDAAAALALFGAEAGIAGATFTNPWLGYDGPAPAAVRARYMARLRDPASWRRPPNLLKLVKGLRRLLAKPSEPDLAAAYRSCPLPATVILAEGDATAQAYRAAMRGTFANIRTNSHSFADTADELEAAVVAALERYSAA